MGDILRKVKESGKPVVVWGLGSPSATIRSGMIEYATEGELAKIWMSSP
jgi:hypothetical protein